MKKDDNLVLLDMNTGEVLSENFTILNEGDRVYRKAQLDYARKKEVRRQFSVEFIWMLFQYGKPLSLGIQQEYLPCLILAATCCSEDYLVGRKEYLRRALNMNKNQWGMFWKEATGCNLLVEKGDVVYINSNHFCKGEIKTDINFIRIFAEFYRALYDVVAGSRVQQRRVSYILDMIPFLNRQTNILSHNRKEQDNDDVVYMSFNEFCDKIGYDRSHSARLKNQLGKFRVDGERVIGFFDNITTLIPNGKYVIVNPKLCFGGDKNESGYKTARTLFKKEQEEWFVNR